MAGIARHVERFWDPRIGATCAATAPESLDPPALAAAGLVGGGAQAEVSAPPARLPAGRDGPGPRPRTGGRGPP